MNRIKNQVFIIICSLLSLLLISSMFLGCKKSPQQEKSAADTFETSIIGFGTPVILIFEVVRDVTGPKHGIALTVVKSPDVKGLYVASLAKKYDFVAGAWLSFSNMRANGEAKLKYVHAPFKRLDKVYVPVNTKEINSLSDIKGKKMGVYGSAAGTSTLLLKFVLKRFYDIDLDKDVNVLYGAPPVIHEALKRGNVDVVFNTISSTPEILDTTKFRVIFDPTDTKWQAKEGYDIRLTGFAVYDDVLKKNPEGVKCFLNAYRDAAQYIVDHPKEIEKRVGKLMDLPEGKELTQLTRAYIDAIDMKWSKKDIEKYMTFGKLYMEMFGTDVLAGVPDDLFLEDFVNFK